MTSPVEQFLSERDAQPVVRICTMGSVDDGKSTLLARLLYETDNLYHDHLQGVLPDKDGSQLAVLVDGLRAEQEQGITIDVAYRYFATERRSFILADAPGHEQYTRNMVTAASDAQVGILLVDVSQGVQPQTKRHLFLASLLRVPRVVVAMNKMDLVGYSEERFHTLRSEIEEFAGRLSIAHLVFIPTVATHGDNVTQTGTNMDWYEGPSLLSFLSELYVGSDANTIDFRFPVQYVLRSKDRKRAYAGRIVSGRVRPGDAVTVLPSRRTSKVNAVHYAGEELTEGQIGASVALELHDELDVSRGEMLVRSANLPKVDQYLEAMVVWMAEEPFDAEGDYVARFRSKSVRLKLEELRYRISVETLAREEATSLALNEIGRASFELTESVAFDTYEKNRATGCFVIVDRMTGATVGAAMIIDRVSGGALRAKSSRDLPVSKNIHREKSSVAAEERFARAGATPKTIWFTGLSGSGKSSVARLVERQLFDAGTPITILDGDNVRHGLNRDLGFSIADRDENIRRVAEVARLFNRAGMTVLCAFISPLRSQRESAKEIIGEEHFVEVFVDAPLAVCEERDPKGLYKKARAGEIKEFSGISSPFEEPKSADIVLETDEDSIDRCVDAVVQFLLK